MHLQHLENEDIIRLEIYFNTNSCFNCIILVKYGEDYKPNIYDYDWKFDFKED